VVTERTGDHAFDEQHYLIELVNSGYQNEEAGIDIESSHLVEASTAQFVRQGWQPVKMPCRDPQPLTQGSETEPAKIYLFDEQLEGQGYITLEAKEAGPWGNEIAITARPAGPGMYDLAVIYKGASFESARKTALLGHSEPGTAEHLPALMQEILQPGPVGLLQAKAAGVRLDVEREGAKLRVQSPLESKNP
jgi:hypothetical protein